MPSNKDFKFANSPTCGPIVYVYFTNKFLTDELNLPENAIEDIITMNGVYEHNLHKIVFEYKGRYFTTNYVETINQETKPWENEYIVVCKQVIEDRVWKTWKDVHYPVIGAEDLEGEEE